MGDVNPKDLAFKTVWTAIAAGLAFLGVELAEADATWVPLATPFITLALAWVRQQLGATPPDAPPVGPLASGRPR
jgi:hypothetical protein